MSSAQIDEVFKLLDARDQLLAAAQASKFTAKQVEIFLNRLETKSYDMHLRSFFDVLSFTHTALAWTLSDRGVSYEVRNGFVRAARKFAYVTNVEANSFMARLIGACRKRRPLADAERSEADYHVLRWLDAWFPLHSAYEGLWDIVMAQFLCDAAQICAFPNPVSEMKIVYTLFNVALVYATKLASRARGQIDVPREIYALASCGLFLCATDQSPTLHEEDVVVLPQTMSDTVLKLANFYVKGDLRYNTEGGQFALAYCQALYDGHLAFLTASMRMENQEIRQWRKWREQVGLGVKDIDTRLNDVVTDAKEKASQTQRRRS